jgi:hypothetical protein
MSVNSRYRRNSEDNEEQPGENGRKSMFFASAVFFGADNIILR